jgi:predicted PurR-regulated permease PerM
MRTSDASGRRRTGERTPSAENAVSAPTTGPTLRTLLTDKVGWLGLRSAQTLAFLALVTVVIIVLLQVKLVVIPVLIALILASALSPVIKWLRRHNISALFATLITLFTAVVVFGGILTMIIIAVENQWDELAVSASEGIDELINFLTNGPLPIDTAMIEDAREAGIDFLTSSQFGSGAIAGVSVATQIVTGALLVVVILFFFLKDGDIIWNFFLRPFRGARLARGRRIGKTTVRVLGGYVRGTATVALVDAVAIGTGLAILGVPLALPLSVIIFATAFIPLVGATVAGILAALVALVANDWIVALIVVGIVILVNQLEGNLLQPVVMAQSLKLHPLVILVALTAGTIVGGIIGAVLAVPIAAVGWSIAKVWNEPDPGALSPQASRPALR